MQGQYCINSIKKYDGKDYQLKIAVLGFMGYHANVEIFLIRAFRKLGHDVIAIDVNNPPNKLLSIKYNNLLLSLPTIRHSYRKYYLEKISNYTVSFLLEQKPDLIITHNDAKLTPDAIKLIRAKLNVPFVSIVADDPTLAIYMPEYLPLIPHFTHLVVPESNFESRLRNLTHQEIIFTPFGVDSSVYFSTEQDDPMYTHLKSEIGYVSNSYRGAPFGLYRGLLLKHLSHLGLKIYGDAGWNYIANYIPEIKQNIHITGYLNSFAMNAFYNQTMICPNIVNPQIVNGVAQRVLDAACAGCFQIVEYKSDLDIIFQKEEIISFKNISELVEKTQWYLSHPLERDEKRLSAQKKVVENYGWDKILNEVINRVFSN